MDSLTLKMSKTYDRLRRTRHSPPVLRLDKATATGYVAVIPAIKSEWYSEFLTDQTTGEQFLQVLMAESSEWATAKLKTSAAAVVLDGFRYKINGKRKPEGAPLVWLLTCSATGEAV